MKNATNKSAQAEFICVYLTYTAPQFLKEHQWLMLAGGFTNGQLVKVVEHTGVRERPELFSTHEEADTRSLLHTIDLATTHSRIIVRCDDTDVLVLLIYTTIGDACVCVFAKLDQFLPVRSQFDSNQHVNSVRIATFQSANFGPLLFAFYCPLFFYEKQNKE